MPDRTIVDRLYDDANCLGLSHVMVYENQPVGMARARKVCRRCAVWRECRLMGLGEEAGIWSAMAQTGRRWWRWRVARGLSPDDVRALCVRAGRLRSLDDAYAFLAGRGVNTDCRAFHDFWYLPVSGPSGLFDFRRPQDDDVSDNASDNVSDGSRA